MTVLCGMLRSGIEKNAIHVGAQEKCENVEGGTTKIKYALDLQMNV